MGKLTILQYCLICIATMVVVYQLVKCASLPDYEQTVFTNQDYSVKIHRDEYGIPHIQANTPNEAIFGIGFVHAQDRLWQMQMRRLLSQGKLSSVLGARALDIDIYIRNVDYMDSARRIVDRMDLQNKAMNQAYADGINEGVKSLEMLPPEFQMLWTDFPEWTIYDTICFNKLMGFTMMNDLQFEIVRTQIKDIYGEKVASYLTGVGPDNQYRSDHSVINSEELKQQSTLHSDEKVPVGEWETAEDIGEFVETIIPQLGGSNAWVIHGNHTTTGYPILASDPHLENGMPSHWYQVELIVQNKFAIGASMPGMPCILSGRNNNFAWGVTILYSDGSDLYEEKLEMRENKMHFLFKKEWYPTRETQISIESEGKQRNITIHHTNHGPVMIKLFDKRKQSIQPDRHYSLQSLVHHDDMSNMKLIMDCVFDVDMKHCINQLKKVIYPNLGLVLASQQDIAYISVGKLIIRSGHPNQFGYIKKGWLGTCEWLSFLTEEEQPTIINPSKGYIVTANNKFLPSFTKYNLEWNTFPSARAIRIDSVIKEQLKNKISIEATKKLQSEFFDIYAQQGMPHLIKLLNTQSKKQQKFIDIISGWDYYLNANSTQASLYMLFEYYYIQKFPKFNWFWSETYLFDIFHFRNLQNMKPDSPWCLNPNNSTQPCIDDIQKSVEQALDHYENLSNKEWSAIHTQYLGHQPFKTKPLDRQIPYGGNRRTVHPSQIDFQQFPFKGLAGANYKMVVSMRPGDNNYFVVDTGVSGNFLSDHYDDQMMIWANRDYITMTMSNKQQHKYKHTTLIKGGQKTDL